MSLTLCVILGLGYLPGNVVVDYDACSYASMDGVQLEIPYGTSVSVIQNTPEAGYSVL